MADTVVNSKITDAITQTNVKVLAEAPAQSMAMVYQTMAHSISLSMQNAVSSQSAMQQLNAAIISTACRQIMSLSDKWFSWVIIDNFWAAAFLSLNFANW